MSAGSGRPRYICICLATVPEISLVLFLPQRKREKMEIPLSQLHSLALASPPAADSCIGPILSRDVTLYQRRLAVGDSEAQITLVVSRSRYPYLFALDWTLDD
jgi:hypothetical protein